MNKIYKVKKNAAGHLVACSEFAKGHTKKAVLGSLLIVGILGMATTASAELVSVGSNTINKNGGAHVGGGNDNQAEGAHSTIGGGNFNTTEAKGKYSTIGGGNFNTAKGEYSTIGGGYYSQANGEYSTIGGGYYNQAEGMHSTIVGGRNNQAKGNNSTVAGGSYNQAEGMHSTIVGGRNNQAKGEGSFAAGVENKANANNAVALGKKNTIDGDNSVAIGSENIVNKEHKNVFILGSGTSGVQSNSVLLGHKTSGKQATAVSDATVGDLNLTGFVGVSKAENGVVSVGHAGGERQIVNVGAGKISADSTDAVNGSQLHALAKVVAKNKADIKNLDDEMNFLSQDITSLHDDVATNQADIGKNKADIAKNNESIDDLYEATNDNLDKISKLDGAVVNNSKNIQNNTQNIEDLAAYNELQDAYAKQQTEAIDALNKASSENTQNIAKNSNHIKTLESNVEEELLNLSGRLLDQKADIDNNINNIYELAQQQDQHSSDIKTLKNNVEEGLLDLSGRLIDQKADLTKDIKALENNVEEGLLNLSGRLIDQKADIAKNQADIAQNQTDIQDLAAYNELQDAYAKQQTEAIDALNKASSANTDRIATAELGIAENKKDAQIAKAQANENKDGIAKNQADIQLHDKKITNLGILHSMVARAVGNNTQGVATNKADIAKNQADIANNIKNIYELAQQQDQHSSDIKTLAKVSAANTDRIAKNKAEADASFETLTKNQNTLIEQGEALVEQNKAINQELEGFAAHADVQDKQILQNQADITTNKTAIEQNINRTVANGFEIEKNKAGIATNKQELILQNDRLNRINETNNHQDQKIDQLGYALKEQGQHFNNRISAVERQTAGGIANAIAIATLPSPSRAGEHHVLFGSGYHNGQAAVSLGAAGLSDTGKSTYKIGLSWSDAGGLSGGVGGSYRWK
ncbi:YadA-like family protein [Moraxella catarrhalis]|uniref:YadA-like family protein n=1 Tax=Moraxella catarrhalis TaxID=480 RepID=UPI00128DE82D|nr:YadA-like family protein [Moraxella catarrhalis]MPX16227.1 cell surface protein [Moraxella catarrhalis]